MSYATRQDLEERFGEGEISRRAMDPDDEDADRTTAALDDASAVIDSYLASAYDLPLAAGEYPLLRSVCCDLARAALYDDAELEAPRRMKKRALEILKGLKGGTAQLVAGDGARIPRRWVAGRAGPDPVMTPDNLKGI